VTKTHVAALLAAICLAACADRAPEQGPGAAARSRPNILLIVADDLGYTDIGAFGGEIATPNLDALAREGVRLSQFYAAPTCSPTRSMLMSGTDNHLAGLGTMFEELRDNQRGHPGYEGYLNDRVAALPELLQDAGYHTYMAGKWHLGLDEAHSPAARGFERSFALTQGGAGHFTDLALIGGRPPIYREDGKQVPLPADFYSSRTYSERLVDYLQTRPDDGRPFFAYLAYTAPHWPLQAPASSMAKYAGRYDAGYDALLAARVNGLEKVGLLADGMRPVPRIASEPAWESLSDDDRRVAARRMEIYAAMVDDLDRHLGTVLDTLKRRGELDNTFIFFMSDNGPEGSDVSTFAGGALGKWAAECCDNSLGNMGKPNSYVWYGPNWARAGAAPFRMHKAYTTEGGIRVPAIARYPSSLPAGTTYGGMATVMDVMPTLLELAGVDHPRTFRGREVLPMRGASVLPALSGASPRVHAEADVMAWELFGRRAIRQGNWKIVWEPAGAQWRPSDPAVTPDRWRLYNLADDPGEQVDLAGREPARLQSLVDKWQAYATETGIVLPDYGSGPSR
jgi:arylsulfatase A-like enzyme